MKWCLFNQLVHCIAQMDLNVTRFFTGCALSFDSSVKHLGYFSLQWSNSFLSWKDISREFQNSHMYLSWSQARWIWWISWNFKLVILADGSLERDLRESKLSESDLLENHDSVGKKNEITWHSLLQYKSWSRVLP